MECQICGKQVNSERGLKIHLSKIHGDTNKKTDAPSSSSTLTPEDILDLVRQEVYKVVQTQLGQILPVVDERLSGVVNEMRKSISENINTIASELASKAQAEIEARFNQTGAGAGNGSGMMQNPVLQALMAKILGGGGSGDGDILTQANRIGNALGAMIMPVAQIQAQAFSNALRLIDLAQKFPYMSESEKSKATSEVGSIMAPEVKRD